MEIKTKITSLIQTLSAPKKGLPTPILHHHIPKTAGTSFNALLDAHFPQNEIMPKGWIQKRKSELGPTVQSEEIFREGFETFRLIHVHANMLKEKPEHWLAVTFLRDPVERVVSQIADWAGLADDDLASLGEENQEIKKRARTWNPEQILDENNQVSSRHLINGMCKSLLAGWYSLKELNKKSTDALAEEALDVLCDNISFFGFVENLKADLDQFKKLSGVKTHRMNRKNKGTSHSSRNNPQLRKAIESKNQADLMLYDKARRIKFE